MSFPLGSLQGDGSTAVAAIGTAWRRPALARSNCCCWPARCAGCCSCWRWRTHDARRHRLHHLGHRRAAAQRGRRARRARVRPGALPVRLFRLVAGAGDAACLAVGAGRGAARRRRRRERRAALGVLARPGAAAGGQLRARVDAPVPLGGRCCPAMPAACSACTLGPLSMRWLGFAGSGVLWIALVPRRHVDGAALLVAARGRADRRDASTRLRRSRVGRRELEEDRRLGEVAAREREEVVEVQRHRSRGARAAGHRAARARDSQVAARRQGTPEAAVRRARRHQAAAGRPARRRGRPPGRRAARVAGDDHRG